ncbi:seryl-tRNA synthetase [Monoraphidium neglectum]|uniref:Seryl-tRNA synthetase n=1 Tax=Monoraphidium neglectum TaxID=145388 RepID=A0A0D2LH86_9CHLO|nr:seryl-tRNA synthetase [Monoraphidium neglectum]KIY91389.1 seryl-tRNA synthetase [Monoraphidium neglectum]|eukprot:XP_013890409.1 seryl-tRNA synthetase [Monoraphidium neglectum]
MLDIVNMEAGVAVAGGRGYYLIREGPLLNQALISFALQFAYKRQYSPVHTPFFMNKDIMGECAQLSQFDEELYKVTGEGEDKYLIATSEQTLCALHRKAWFEKAELPVK